MSIHPEDANSYADQLHRDLAALTAVVQDIAELLGQVIQGGESVRVNGLIVTREDRP